MHHPLSGTPTKWWRWSPCFGMMMMVTMMMLEIIMMMNICQMINIPMLRNDDDGVFAKRLPYHDGNINFCSFLVFQSTIITWVQKDWYLSICLCVFAGLYPGWGVQDARHTVAVSIRGHPPPTHPAYIPHPHQYLANDPGQPAQAFFVTISKYHTVAAGINTALHLLDKWLWKK